MVKYSLQQFIAAPSNVVWLLLQGHKSTLKQDNQYQYNTLDNIPNIANIPRVIVPSVILGK